METSIYLINIYLLLFSFLIFTSYLTVVVIKFGVLPSISDSYYYFEKQKLGFIFTLFCWLFSFPLIFSATTGLLFFAGSGILFVGAAPNFKLKSEGDVHTIAAISGIVLGMLSLVFDFNIYIGVGIFGIITLIFKIFRMKNKTWWIEIAAFIIILISLLVYNGKML